jgi:hypothetical protein
MLLGSRTIGPILISIGMLTGSRTTGLNLISVEDKTNIIATTVRQRR